MDSEALRARAIARHRYLTLIIADHEITSELEAARTLRDGQVLQEVRVNGRSLCQIDQWISYAEDALEEADGIDRKQVEWAPYAEVTTVERYINIKDYPDEDKDPYGEAYYADTEAQPNQSNKQSTSRFTPPSPLHTVPEEAAENFLPPFPSRSTADPTSSKTPEDYLSALESLYETLDQLGYSNQAARMNQNEESQEESSKGPRVNRFRRD